MLAFVTSSIQQNWQFVTVKIRLYRLQLSCSLSLSPPRISSSRGSQLPHWELPYGDTLLVTESTFRSTPNKELKPSVQQRKKKGLLTNTCVNLGSDPSALVQPWGDTIPVDSLTITSWETMSKNHPARQLPDVWPWEMKRTNVCCLKLLSLGVIYYAEIKQYTSSGEPYISPTSQIQFLDLPVYRTEAKELHVQWQQADAISNGNTKDFKKLVFINKLWEGEKENQESDQPKET